MVLPRQRAAPGDGAEEQQEEGKTPTPLPTHRQDLWLGQALGLRFEEGTTHGLPHPTLLCCARTAVCVARVKQQSTTVFKIKEKNNPVCYSVPQAAVLGTVQGQK